jgi:hypothetical protein
MHREKPLAERMYGDPCYTELVRVIGYQGCRFGELEGKLRPLVERFGEQRVEVASYHVLTYEGQVMRDARPGADVKLRGEARKLAWGLLGPPPEHPWHDAYKNGTRIPLPWEKPEPPPVEEEEESAEGPAVVGQGVSPEACALKARGKNRRGLMCMLRDARKKFQQHGKRSFSGKEAKKEIAAAEEELGRRGLPIPREGEETAEWDRKPS